MNYRTKTPGWLVASTALAGALGGGADARAQVAFPDLVYGATVETRMKSDQTLNKLAGADPFNNTFNETEAEGYVNIGRYFSLNGKLIVEQLRSVTDNAFFREEGLYAEQLYATVNLDPARIYGGKIHPHFGRAWDIAPGLYGTDFAEDYELTEKIGMGAAVDIHAHGVHTLSFEGFFADTGAFAHSAFTRPASGDAQALRLGRLRRGDGGVSNTGQPDNYAITLEGQRIPELRGFGYALGYVLQRGSEAGGENDERSWVVGGWWDIPTTGQIAVTPLVEYVRQHDSQGTDGGADYLTAGIEIGLPRGWTLAGFGTLRNVEATSTTQSFVDYQVGASVKYDLGATLLRDFVREHRLFRDLSIEGGYKHERVQGENLNTVGLELKWEKSF